MKPIRMLVVLLVLLVTSSCFGGKGSAGNGGPINPIIAAVTAGGRVGLDPNFLANALLGTILLANMVPFGTAGGDVRFRLDGTTEVEPEETEVILAPGETRRVTVRALTSALAVMTMVVTAELVVGTLTQTFPLQWINVMANSNALFLMTQFGNSQLAALWFASTLIVPIALLTLHSSNSVPGRIPSLRTEIRLIGAALLYFTLAQLVATFAGAQDDGGEAFPLGQGQHGFAVKAEPSLPLTAGDYCTFWMSVSEAIPISDPQKHYQYAFVMDTDANLANNYTASASFPNDFFSGTDRWYELLYTPANGWRLQCKVIGPGNSITTVASAARMVIREDSIVLFVPRSEFVLDKPPFRATSFCHNGDFGLNPPHEWGGDPTPTVAEALHAWQ